MSGQRNKGFRVASGQHSVFKNASASQEVHGGEPCVNRSDTVYAFVGSNMMCFITFVVTKRSHVQGVRHLFYCRKRVGLGIGYNRLEVKDAKNKACT
jgi:hypothetical protein